MFPRAAQSAVSPEHPTMALTSNVARICRGGVCMEVSNATAEDPTKVKRALATVDKLAQTLRNVNPSAETTMNAPSLAEFALDVVLLCVVVVALGVLVKALTWTGKQLCLLTEPFFSAMDKSYKEHMERAALLEKARAADTEKER